MSRAPLKSRAPLWFGLLVASLVPAQWPARGWTDYRSLADAWVREARADDPVTEVARQRYLDGVKAYDAGRYEDARTAFLQAYALKKHPAVLLNLGQSELRSGHPVDAGNHLLQFLREHKEATPEQQETARQAIEDCKRRAPHVIIVVDVSGADVSADGTLLGKSPIVDPLFVEPGIRTFVATYGSQSMTTTVDARVGPPATASLTVGAASPPAGAPVAPPPTEPYPPPPQPGFTFGGPTPGADSGSREPFFDWYARKPLAWVGTGVTAIGLGLGIGFSIAASQASSAADAHAAEIRAEADKDGIDKPCKLEDSDELDPPKYKGPCNTLRADLSDYDTDSAVAAVGWIAFGVGLVGTVTYAMVDWFPNKKRRGADAEPEAGVTVSVAPVVSPTHQGAFVVGSF